MEKLCDSYLKGQERPPTEMTENLSTMSIEEREQLACPLCSLPPFPSLLSLPPFLGLKNYYRISLHG